MLILVLRSTTTSPGINIFVALLHLQTDLLDSWKGTSSLAKQTSKKMHILHWSVPYYNTHPLYGTPSSHQEDWADSTQSCQICGKWPLKHSSITKILHDLNWTTLKTRRTSTDSQYFRKQDWGSLPYWWTTSFSRLNVCHSTIILIATRSSRQIKTATTASYQIP